MQISCSRHSFAVEQARRPLFVAGFDEIDRITAYKRDEITTDLVCFEIALKNREAITLHEEMTGFDHWVGLVERIPGFDQDWREKILSQPFARNETVLLDRSVA